jgi:predicted Rossmann fold nucleotide-binding protein DprA/Smf involved in DNA uptake
MAEGAFAACSVGDILVALSLGGAVVPMDTVAPGTKRRPRRRPRAGRERMVYDALSYDPSSLDQLALLTGLDFSALCGTLEGLAQAGLAKDTGGWWERA